MSETQKRHRAFTDGRPVSEFRQSGVLWALNRHVLHPRGFALALHIENLDTPEEVVTGWSLLGNGTEVYAFSEADDDGGFDQFEAFLAESRDQ